MKQLPVFFGILAAAVFVASAPHSARAEGLQVPSSCHSTWQELKGSLQGSTLRAGTYVMKNYQVDGQYLVVAIDSIKNGTVKGREHVYGHGDYRHTFTGTADGATVAWTDDIGLSVIAEATPGGLVGVRNSHKWGGSCFQFDLRPQP